MKHKLTMSMDKELVLIAKKYAKLKYTSVTQIVRDYFLQLKNELEALEGAQEGAVDAPSDETHRLVESQSSSFERSEQHDSTKTSETETQ